MRVLSYVLDANVVVAGFRSGRRASRQLLLTALNREFELLISVPLMLEYEAVLTRPENWTACGLRATHVEAVLDDLASIGERFARPSMAS